MPKDLCSALAETTDGATFNVNQLVHTRPAMQKRFLDVFSRLVVKKAAKPSCLQCACSAGRPLCRACGAEPLTWSFF